MEALWLVIANGELDLDELNPDQINMPEMWVPVDAKEQIRQANLAIAEDQDQVIDWLIEKRSLEEPTYYTLVYIFKIFLVFSFHHFVIRTTWDLIPTDL